jgi:redox-sensitive bicupin YhaK (pirin superfamily)
MRIAALLLPLSGKPINEPSVVPGPFVMNTEAELVEAIADLE